MRQNTNSTKRLAWIVTLLGALTLAAGFIYFMTTAEAPNQFSSYRQQANQRSDFRLAATQCGMVEIVGGMVMVVGIVMLIYAYAVAPKKQVEPADEIAAG